MKGNNGGRPQMVLDWEKIEKLCAIHCTGEEISNILAISYETLVLAIQKKYKLSFPEYFAQKAARGKMSLRRRQYEAAMSGDRVMLIWLGKQYLDQKDNSRIDINTPIQNPVQLRITLPSNGRELKK